MTAVTIAIPFYNAQTYLAQAIDSVLWQTHKDFVLLLMDDGSTDGSLGIANKYAEKDPRIQVFSDGENKNLGFRLNQIPSLVETEFLARMDADDIMHPERIAKQLQALLQDPTIDVLGTNIYSIDENDAVNGIRDEISTEKVVPVRTFWHPTVMAKTEWFRKHPYDVQAERIEDAELWLSQFQQSKFMKLSEPLLFYREFGNKYWKKYVKGNKGVLYALKKHGYSPIFIKFALRYFAAQAVYFLMDLVGKEGLMIQNRNAIPLDNLKIEDLIHGKV